MRKCFSCGQPIPDKHISVIEDNRAFHTKCYRNYIAVQRLMVRLAVKHMKGGDKQ